MGGHHSSCQILQSHQRIPHRLCVAEIGGSRDNRHPWLEVTSKMPMKQERRDTQGEVCREGEKLRINHKESTLCQAVLGTNNRVPDL